MFDYQKVWMLLDIVHKAAAAGPAYTWFGDQAYAELNKMKQAQVAAWEQSQSTMKKGDEDV